MTEDEIITNLIRRANVSTGLFFGHKPQGKYWGVISTEDNDEQKLEDFRSTFGGEVYLNLRTKISYGEYKWFIANEQATRICRLLVVRPAFRMLTPKYAIAKQIIQYADMLACV